LAVYNRVYEQRLDEEQHQQAAGEVQNSRQASGQLQTQCAYWWKCRQLSCCCWVRKTNPRATEQSEKFHVKRGIPSIICFADYSQSSASQVLQEKARSSS